MSQVQRARRRAKIAAAVRKGRTAAEAAALFGVELSTAYEACREHGLNLGRGGNAGYFAQMAARREAMADAVRDGATVAQVARRFRVGDRTVRAACLAHGFEAPRWLAKREPSLRARAALAKRGSVAPPKRTVATSWPGSDRRRAEALRLLATTDLTYAEIGRRVGISRQRVGQVFREAAGTRG
jgi:transposase